MSASPEYPQQANLPPLPPSKKRGNGMAALLIGLIVVALLGVVGIVVLVRGMTPDVALPAPSSAAPSQTAAPEPVVVTVTAPPRTAAVASTPASTPTPSPTPVETPAAVETVATTEATVETSAPDRKPIQPRYERFAPLSQGDYGSNVRSLQELLQWRGIRTLDDSTFGPATERSVRQWQAQNGLEITGVVDDTTWESLLPDLSVGSSGEGVKILQRALTDWGLYNKKIDGDFGPVTKDAVIAFQNWRGLVVDGKVGKQTWAALLS